MSTTHYTILTVTIHCPYAQTTITHTFATRLIQRSLCIGMVKTLSFNCWGSCSSQAFCMQTLATTLWALALVCHGILQKFLQHGTGIDWTIIGHWAKDQSNKRPPKNGALNKSGQHKLQLMAPCHTAYPTPAPTPNTPNRRQWWYWHQ